MLTLLHSEADFYDISFVLGPRLGSSYHNPIHYAVSFHASSAL